MRYRVDFNTLFEQLEANDTVRLQDLQITATTGSYNKPLAITIPVHAVEAFTVALEDAEMVADRGAAIRFRTLVFNAVRAAMEAQQERVAAAKEQAAALAQAAQPSDAGSTGEAAGFEVE